MSSRTTFTEKRPFFIEGNNILEAGTSNYYYSRRIGARPTGAATGQHVWTIRYLPPFSVRRLTGRFRNGLSVGFLGAVTNGETARVSNNGLQSDVVVTHHGASAVRLNNTDAVVRRRAHDTRFREDAGTPMALLVRNALTTGVDTHPLQDRTYELSGNVGPSSMVIRQPSHAMQRASGHHE